MNDFMDLLRAFLSTYFRIKIILIFYYFLENRIEDAIKYFKKARAFNLFGGNFFYLANYEYQRLSIAEEMNLKKE